MSSPAPAPPAPTPAIDDASTGAPWVVVVAIVGSSMTFIDSSAVTVALPSIGRDLHAGAADLQWIVEGYGLFLSALILIGGSLGDVFGRRRIFVLGIGLFALSSLACAWAQSIVMLDLARCVQGVGGALATPGSLALISANYRGAARGRAIGTWSGFASITAAIGPLLGGWLTQAASWRDVFLINVPLAAFVIVAALVRVPESRDDVDAPSIDSPGAVLATLALGALTYGLIRLQRGAPYAPAVVTIGAGVVACAAFVAWQRRARSPMIPPGIFANRIFVGANVYTVLLYAALGGALYFIPIDLQNVQGYSPAAAGASLLPFIVIMFAASRWSGGLVATVGARVPMLAGAVIEGIGFVAYARIGVHGSYLTTVLPAAVILGIGGALFVAPLTTTVMEAIEPARAGIASGINNALSRVAGLLAIAVFGVIASVTLYGDFDRLAGPLNLSAQTRATLAGERAVLASGTAPANVREPDRRRVEAVVHDAYASGFTSVMWMAAVLCWLAAIVAFRTIPGRENARKKSLRPPAA